MLVNADAKALEWHSIVQLSQDQTALEEFAQKVDVHSVNQQAFSLPSRLIAKTYLFRTIFNEGKGYAFTVDPNFMHVSTSVKYWEEVGEKFYEKYKGIKNIHTEWKRQVASGLPLEGPSGRQWRYEMKPNWKGEMEWPVNDLINHPVQGTGADVMMLARLSLASRLKKLANPEILMISTVHDSIVLDTPKQHIPMLVELFHSVFDDLPKNIKKCWGYEWNTPLTCEVSVGPNMKDLEEISRS